VQEEIEREVQKDIWDSFLNKCSFFSTNIITKNAAKSPFFRWSRHESLSLKRYLQVMFDKIN